MTDPLTPAELAEIEARAEAATEGPWETRGLDVYQPAGRHIAYTGPQREQDYPESCRRVDDANAAFIAAARTDVPRLAREVARLRAENDAMREMLRDLEWHDSAAYVDYADRDYCPVCECSSVVGHAPDCALAALLKEAHND